MLNGGLDSSRLFFFALYLAETKANTTAAGGVSPPSPIKFSYSMYKVNCLIDIRRYFCGIHNFEIIHMINSNDLPGSVEWECAACGGLTRRQKSLNKY